MTLTLPQSYRDPGFQRHIERLQRAEPRDSPGWLEVLREPWVKDAPFAGAETETHCPLGHCGQWEIGWPPEPHNGREHVRRRCGVCESTWLERKS